ncbi:hypothetical protein HYW55_00275 [Candidatus Gottesmanbacteria bacterium]|nr:hypothetical protein [Candidatus Gottesmanbacteria bacterium]
MPAIERAPSIEHQYSPELQIVRILPLQMAHPDEIRAQLQSQLDGGDFKPWETEMTSLYMTLRGPETKTPNTVMMIGGEIPESDPQTKKKVGLHEGALRVLARSAHAYGVTNTDLRIIRERKPFSWNSPRGRIFAKEFVLSTEVPPDFEPLALDPKTRYHAFQKFTLGSFKRLLAKEYIKVNGENYRLAGNLRGDKRNRRQDHRLSADGEDVVKTRTSLFETLEKFEMETRREVALALIDQVVPDKRIYSNYFTPSWKERWRMSFRKYTFGSDRSRAAFRDHYREFLIDYAQKILPIRSPDGTPRDLSSNYVIRDLWRAAEAVYLGKLTRFNSRLPIQGPRRDAIEPKLLGANSDQYYEELYSHGSERFGRYLRFLQQALETETALATFKKLLDVRRLKTDRRSISNEKLNDKTQTDLLNYEQIVRTVYEEFMQSFLPSDTYVAYVRGYPDEDTRLGLWRRIYASYSQMNDTFINFLTTSPARRLASHPAVTVGLDTAMSVQSDQLIEHILGTFGINPYKVGNTLLDRATALEYRRKMIGIMEDMEDVKPHHEEQIAQDTYFLRDVLIHLAKPGTTIQRYLLVYDEKKGVAKLLDLKTPWKEISAEIIRPVDVITCHIDGIDVQVAYYFGSKRYEELKRKSIERDTPARKILDITRFAIFIGDFDTFGKWVDGTEKDIRKRLVYQLEERLQEIAQDPKLCGYKYTEDVGEDKKRKDVLDGDTATAGSGASKTGLPAIKKYITLKITSPLRDEVQTQELRLMPSALAAVEWNLDTESYASERLRTTKFQTAREGEKVLYQYMTYPVTRILWPPQIEEFRLRYINLMEGPKPPATLTRWRLAALQFTEWLESHIVPPTEE